MSKILFQGSREEIKQIIGFLSKLKNEMQTNKPLSKFEANEVDLSEWNTFLESTEESLGEITMMACHLNL